MKKIVMSMMVVGAVALFAMGCQKEEPKTVTEEVKEAAAGADAAAKAKKPKDHPNH